MADPGGADAAGARQRGQRAATDRRHLGRQDGELFVTSRKLATDTRGLALIEFAIVLPILLTLYLGGFQLGDGIACSRKITIATRAIADLIAQNQSGSTTASEVDSNLSAATQVLAPYAASNAVIRITEVGTDYNLKTTVQWSRAANGAAYKPGAVATIPLAMRIPGTYFLFAETSYAYTPSVNFGFVNAMNLSDSLYMLPRNSNSITCTDC
nr:TadE/TadG family type IV pilus assembly protein [Sphingomonas sp. CROZ-RG-20F-R02-07]